MMSDKQLQLAVEEELDFEPSVDSAHIGVTAENGIVTLTGNVPSYVQKVAAERAAQRVRGVRAIAQEIEVRYPEDRKADDDQVAERALHVVAWYASIPQNAIKVKVQQGWVTLNGMVDWHYQRTNVEASVRKLTGVTGVSNFIELRPAPAAQAADVERKIKAALTRNAALGVTGIHVRVGDDGAVTLEGKVHTWSERSLAESAAWSVPGVRAVHDCLALA